MMTKGPARSATSLTGLLKANMGLLTKAERRVAHVLFANDLMPGLDTVAAVAAKAKVSGPTVLRFVTKQGFGGYAEFQTALREEIAAKVSSPLSLYKRGQPLRSSEKRNALSMSLTAFTEGLHATFRSEQASAVAALARLLADPSRHVWLVGGRFSQMVAEILWAHVVQLRPKAHLVSPVVSRRQEALLDVRRDHLVVALDFRRYQSDTIAFASIAAERGAKVALITDRWLSPIATFADHIVTCDVDAASPFDSLVSPLALIELLVASVTEATGKTGRERIEALEAIRRAFSRATSEAERPSIQSDSDAEVK